jgi:predicted nucleotidyltransferase
MDQTVALPPEIELGLNEFLDAARQAFREELISAVLFGSAAEGRLRSVSDVNLLLLLKRFDKGRVDLVREPFRTAHAAIRLDVMFLVETEIEPVMDAFAVKFSDILSRRRILFGPDPFVNLVIPPETVRRRTMQVLLNLMLRLRERYALVSLREEQLAHVVADLAGPLRACAASVLALEGRHAPSPREALALVLAEQDASGGNEVAKLIDTARREGGLPPGTAAPLIFSLMGVAEWLYERISSVPAGAGTGHG